MGKGDDANCPNNLEAVGNIRELNMWKGNLIWIESGNNIKVLDMTTRNISNIVGMDLNMNHISSITVDSKTNDIYMADRGKLLLEILSTSLIIKKIIILLRKWKRRLVAQVSSILGLRELMT